MNQSLFHLLWYRVAELKPNLRHHARVHRHEYRGQIWYIVRNSVSGSTHRFTCTANQIIARMDGASTVEDIWVKANSQLADDAISQGQVIQLLAQLHSADLLQCDSSPHTLELFERFQRQQHAKWKQRLLSPLSLKLPLWNPDGFLESWAWLVRPLFSWPALIIWCLFVGSMSMLAAVHWAELTENSLDRILNLQNLFLIWLIYPVLKALHELGHGFAAKVWGGEVNEMGISFLVFTPVPYVEASSSSAFPEKHRRIVVAAAGMIVEMLLASIALVIWLNAEAGLVRAIAFNVMLIGGVSTLLFNGNPLLRFDGYYILSDLIEIQSLASRSVKYYGYLCQRYLLGLKDVPSPANASGETRWFVGYGIAAYLYRIAITVVIVLFIAEKSFTLGMLIAGLLSFTLLVLPGKKILRFLLTDSRIRQRKFRAVSMSVSIAVAFVCGLFLPLPLYTVSEGVVWLPEKSRVRSYTEGFVEEILVKPNAQVQAGDPLIRCEDPLLLTQIKIQEARLRELEAKYSAQLQEDRLAAERHNEEIVRVKAELERSREKHQGLTLRSSTAGRFVLPDSEDVVGRFLRQGDMVGYVIDRKELTARVVVSQDDIDRVRHQRQGLELNFADNLSASLPVLVKREVPSATNQLPSKALGTLGGGKIAVMPNDKNGVTSLQKYFLLDIALPDHAPVTTVGGRVYVRFDHGNDFLINRVSRSLRQLFLKRFNV